MLKLGKLVLVLSMTLVLNACNKEQVECDCSNAVTQALKEAKQTKKKSVRKNKAPEEKLANKLKRQEARESGLNLRLNKSKFEELNLTQLQKDEINQAKKIFDDDLVELNKQSNDTVQLLNDAMRSGNLGSIKQVLLEKENIKQAQRKQELEYSMSVYSKLTSEQLVLLANSSRLSQSLLDIKTSDKANKKGKGKRDKRGKRNQNKRDKS